MPQGLQVFDMTGFMTLDITDSITRFLGIASVSGNSGTIYHDGFSTGRPWAHPIPKGGFAHSRFQTATCEFSWSGNAMTWTRRYNAGSAPNNFDIVYGVY